MSRQRDREVATQTMSQAKSTAQQTVATSSTRRWLAWLSPVLLIVAAVLLVASIPFPYWGLVLEAPQYPEGLEVRVFVNEMTGDDDPQIDEVQEITGLNHYIGMKPLGEAATFERSIAIPGIIVMVIALGIVAFVRRRWVWLLALPAAVFPLVFLGDLAYWLNDYGQNLDPYAPLSSAIHPFTPTIIGEGIIGQFKTVAYVNTGWYLAVVAAVLVIVALLLRWRGGRAAAGS
ncbi:MAG: cytochrome C [Anaerolineae bacterium]|nr:cytochrome C [Anaerolineae bacterium]